MLTTKKKHRTQKGGNNLNSFTEEKEGSWTKRVGGRTREGRGAANAEEKSARKSRGKKRKVSATTRGFGRGRRGARASFSDQSFPGVD